ncbi:MAG TPA: hypothetical protein VFK13_11985 [Gemmatimonadaceae bacterium]|nr:hypothetical protein [Gemmatimonadaceae bacterium]
MMPDTSTAPGTNQEAGTPVATPPKRTSGHRHTDVRDAVAEMAARAQEISQEAGSRIAQAMKDVISAGAGLAVFAVESARDLVQYMVRRGQMTQEEADKLMREVEAAGGKRAAPRPASRPSASTTAPSAPAAPVRPSAPAAAANGGKEKARAARNGARTPASAAAKRASKSGSSTSSSKRTSPAAKRSATRSGGSRATGKAPSRKKKR